MPQRRGKTIKKYNKQAGKTTVRKDKKLGALAPGIRRSSRGKKYFENRKNRSDLYGNV